MGEDGIAEQPDGRFVARRTPLAYVIGFAYRDYQEFLGMPKWVTSDLWDIEATEPKELYLYPVDYLA